MDSITYVGLDVRKTTISVAVADGGRSGEVWQLGVFANRADGRAQLKTDAGHSHRFVAEPQLPARSLKPLDHLAHNDACTVITPSLIPTKAGDRIKTDRRDAVMLARLHRAGELTGVWVPDAVHEAMRDLVRARATAMKVLSKARQHLGGFLLRHGKIYSGVRTRTQAYRRWLTTVRFDHPAHQIVLQDYIDAVTDAERRVDRLTRQITEHLPDWSMAPVATAIQAMRGIALINAVTIVAEVGDFSRFGNPRQLMAYLGLAPSGHSSGSAVRRGDHESRQFLRATRADRGSLDLPHAGTR